MEFQKLLSKIKEFTRGVDYIINFVDITEDKRYEKIEVYSISSPRLKKEARGLVLNNSNTENCLFSRVGREISGKWYGYEKGIGADPDKFEIKVISPEEKEKFQRIKS